MKAMVMRSYGGPEVMEMADLPVPRPGEGQILVRVAAAGLNPVDWKIRKGMVRPLVRLRLPAVLGFDFAGKVEETGPGCRTLAIGDQVFGMTNRTSIGTFAQFAVMREDLAAVKPERLSFEEASAVPLAALTALQALRDLAKAGKGSRVLVNGAAGGVGSFAVQIARNLGAKTTGTASAKNLGLVRDLGADEAVDYAAGDVTRGPARFDAVFDAVSRLSPGRCRRILAPGGIFICTLPRPSVLLRFLLGPLLPPRVRLVGVKPNPADLSVLRSWIEEGKLRPVIDSVWPLEDLAGAMARSESGHARGKIVIKVPQI